VGSRLLAEVIEKALDVFECVADAGPCSLPDIASRCALPVSTAHRIVTALVQRGYLISERRGRYRLGARWWTVGKRASFPSLLAEVARRPLRELARATGAHAHLAILEGDMVTYLVKERHGHDVVHSQEQMQLEAYCTALGKMLLAYLEPTELEAYLAGDFVRLTSRTVTDPNEIKADVTEARTRGWATEIEETAPNLMCLSVPIADKAGQVHAAISISVVSESPTRVLLLERLPLLQQARDAIETKLFPISPWRGPPSP